MKESESKKWSKKERKREGREKDTGQERGKGEREREGGEKVIAD